MKRQFFRVPQLALLGSILINLSCFAADSESTESKGKQVEVKDVDGLVKALAAARGHDGAPLHIVLADGEYKTEKSLRLIAANQVQISAAKGASITCSKPKAEVFVIAYCDHVRLSNLTLRHDPAPKQGESLDSLVRIDHSKNIRLESCTLNISMIKPAKTKPEPPDELPKASPVVVEFLGQKLLDVVGNPDRILTYEVTAKDEEKYEKMLGPYSIVKEGAELNPAQSKTLIGVVYDEKTYNFEFLKRGVLYPSHGFKFIKGDQEVILILDMTRRELVYLFDKKARKEDCDRAVEVLNGLIEELFPK